MLVQVVLITAETLGVERALHRAAESVESEAARLEALVERRRKAHRDDDCATIAHALH